MNSKILKKSYSDLVQGVVWSRALLGVAVFALLIAVFALSNQKERVILQPVTLTDDAWVEENAASETYKTSWGAYLGTLMGNVTPGKLSFIKERIEPLL